MIKHIKILLYGVPVVVLLVFVSYLGAMYPAVFAILLALFLSYIFGLLVKHLWETRHW